VAARRLVVVMLILLAISTLAAALLPPPENNNPTTTDGAKPKEKRRSPEAAPSPSETGLLLVSRMRVSSQRPKTVRIERGDELRLDVVAPFGADIEIPGFGLTEPVTPFAAAPFDLLATSVGSFGVRVVGTEQPVGRLLVGKPDSGRCGVSTPATPQGRGTIPPCSPRGKPGSPGSGRSARRP
jgi:hypothetical protein